MTENISGLDTLHNHRVEKDTYLYLDYTECYKGT